MSDRPGLSIFDDPEDNGDSGDNEATQVIPAVKQQKTPTSTTPAAAPAAAAPRPATPAARAESTSARPTFPVVRRGGYDTAAVDRQISTLAGEKAGLSASLQETKSKLTALEQELAALREQVSENENPTYAGLGGRASEMLRLAEEQSDDVLVQARAQADEIKRQSAKDADVLRAEAARDAEDMRMVQLKELDETRARAMADVEQERTMSKAEADDLLGSARRESEQLRLAAQQETNAMRTSAKRDAEQARAAADREVQEARRTLAVEKERLTREAAEHHTTATAETQKLVEEAEARANAAEARGREAVNAAASHRKQAHDEADRLLSHARREAEQIVSSAQTQAATFTAAGQAEAERELAVLKAEVDRYQKRRDAIVGQLGALRDVITGFGDEPSEDRHRHVSCRPLGRDGSPVRRHDTTQAARGGDVSLQHPFRARLLPRRRGLPGLVAGRPRALGRLDADPDRGRRVPRGRAQPGRRVARPPRPGPQLVGAGGDHRRAARRRAVLLRPGPGHHRPGLHDRQERPRVVRRARSTTAPSGACDRQYDLLDKAQKALSGGNVGSALFGGVVGVGLKLLSFVANTFIVVVLTLYLLATLPKVKRSAYRFAPASRRERVAELGDRIIDNVGSYVSGAFVVAMAAGISSMVFLFVVGLSEYAVALAAVVALLDVIPMIGATLGAVIVTLIGFATDPHIGLYCLIFYVVYQQFENYVIYPRVMSRSVEPAGLDHRDRGPDRRGPAGRHRRAAGDPHGRGDHAARQGSVHAPPGSPLARHVLEDRGRPVGVRAGVRGLHRPVPLRRQRYVDPGSDPLRRPGPGRSRRHRPTGAWRRRRRSPRPAARRRTAPGPRRAAGSRRARAPARSAACRTPPTRRGARAPE